MLIQLLSASVSFVDYAAVLTDTPLFLCPYAVLATQAQH